MIEIVMASPPEKDIFIVFDYIEHDLSGLMKSEIASNLFESSESECVIKGIMFQLLEGLKYLHENAMIIHRDLKCPNILIDKFGCVKLADFGLAKLQDGPSIDSHYKCSSRGSPIMTNRVITLWYRPPEVLFGDDHYGPEVDIWSLGCIFAEMLLLKPAFAGSDEVSQIEAILVGLFREDTEIDEPFSCLSHLPWYDIIPDRLKRNFMAPSGSFNLYDSLSKARVSPEALRILKLMLSIDPKKRIDCNKVLESKYFDECSQPRFLERYRKAFEHFSSSGVELKGHLNEKNLK